jgi:hypothetical protein
VYREAVKPDPYFDPSLVNETANETPKAP